MHLDNIYTAHTHSSHFECQVSAPLPTGLQTVLLNVQSQRMRFEGTVGFF